MRKIILILALAVSVSAQTFSHWSYPYNKAVDDKVIATIENALAHGYTTEPIRLPMTYKYTGTDSSFTVFDFSAGIFRVYDPTAKVKELARENTVLVYTKPKGEKLTKQTSVGNDYILPAQKPIFAADAKELAKATVEAVDMRKCVDAKCKEGKRRIEAWAEVKAEKATAVVVNPKISK